MGLGYYHDDTPAGLAPPGAAGPGPAPAAAAAAGAGGPAGYGADDDDVGGANKGPKKTRQELIAERQAARNAALAKAGRGRAKMGGEDELDPMDPVRGRGGGQA